MLHFKLSVVFILVAAVLATVDQHQGTPPRVGSPASLSTGPGLKDGIPRLAHKGVTISPPAGPRANDKKLRSDSDPLPSSHGPRENFRSSTDPKSGAAGGSKNDKTHLRVIPPATQFGRVMFGLETPLSGSGSEKSPIESPTYGARATKAIKNLFTVPRIFNTRSKQGKLPQTSASSSPQGSNPSSPLPIIDIKNSGESSRSGSLEESRASSSAKSTASLRSTAEVTKPVDPKKIYRKFTVVEAPASSSHILPAAEAHSPDHEGRNPNPSTKKSTMTKRFHDVRKVFDNTKGKR